MNQAIPFLNNLFLQYSILKDMDLNFFFDFLNFFLKKIISIFFLI